MYAIPSSLSSPHNLSLLCTSIIHFVNDAGSDPTQPGIFPKLSFVKVDMTTGNPTDIASLTFKIVESSIEKDETCIINVHNYVKNSLN